MEHKSKLDYANQYKVRVDVNAAWFSSRFLLHLHRQGEGLCIETGEKKMIFLSLERTLDFCVNLKCNRNESNKRIFHLN